MNYPVHSPGEYTGLQRNIRYISLAVHLILRATMVQVHTSSILANTGE